ncbi:MAG: hypothetical protein JJU06_12790 [Ectothiorhodospiraceae bacterium]|nr:hypothetical protein [Ectothiorhodospiraceae bacterium]MCH8503374.1 hypothetical protein [Ectothiorhodospiraceae bacterium]
MSKPVLIEVPPERIEGVIIKRDRVRRFRFALSGLGLPPRVKRGHWHEWVIPVFEHPTVALMSAFHYERFEPERCREHLERYFQLRGLGNDEARDKSARKLEAYVERYRLLASAYQRHGYRPGTADEEIGVAIGPDGQLFKASEGQHRFGLALAMKLPIVVAEVRYVHADWWRRTRTGLRGNLENSVCAMLQR